MATLDEGTGYGRPQGTYDAQLTLVGPGTPAGELLRRYWHPVALSEQASSTPREVRVLGEDLVLFRDGDGRPGLVAAHCCHRGASLYFGKVEPEGLRCCYHGWLFDVEGHCLDQQCEPDGGRSKGKIRQPWYPVQERYGLIFAYMGPPTKKPVLPRLADLEDLRDDEHLLTDDSSRGGGGPQILPCNWLQHVENIADPTHVAVLHESHSGVQFGDQIFGLSKELEFQRTPFGVCFVAKRGGRNGERQWTAMAEIANFTMRIVPRAGRPPTEQEPVVGVRGIGWTVPIDDTHYRIYFCGRVPKSVQSLEPDKVERRGNKYWPQMTPEERRDFPGDYEAQTSQGPITLHSAEHLVPADRGVVMFRRLLREQIEVVAAGGDPIGVSFDPNAAPLEFRSKKRLLPEHEPA